MQPALQHRNLACHDVLLYHALQEVNVGWNGKGHGHDELVEKDGKFVYMMTIQYVAGGDERHAKNACNIIDAWSRTCTKFCGE